MIKPPAVVVGWQGDADSGFLRLLDQTLLPARAEYVDCRSVESVWDAIRRLVVRGAPALGVAAGYGMVIAAQAATAQAAADPARVLAELDKAAAYLESSRPTAVNLSWAVRRVLARAGGTAVPKGFAAVKDHGRGKDSAAVPPESGAAGASRLRQVVLDEARQIHAEDQAMCAAIGRHAEPLIRACRGVLTHCNAGALATAGIGTATAGMYAAHAAGHRFTVYCDETRPLLQGSRLTAWELTQAGIDAVVITDSMAAHVLGQGRVQMVIVGADRIAANGDTANKIGTYGLALAARYHNVPFHVAAPHSTFDLSIASGREIPIEERGGEEITEGFGRRTAPQGVRTYCPAFDVTPAELITAIITDRGVIQPVCEREIRRLLEGPVI